MEESEGSDEDQSGSETEDYAKRDVLHAPAQNLGSKKQEKSLQEKLQLSREHREIRRKLNRVEEINEADISDVNSWIKNINANVVDNNLVIL